MKSSLEHIPFDKREELLQLSELISSFDKVEMVILFGSYAKGSWVEDRYIENNTIYEYRSDYDLLIVLKHDDFKLKWKIENLVKTDLLDTGNVSTPLGFIFHGIKHLNQALTIGNYFFKDITEEGILLYDSGRCNLACPRKLSCEEYQTKAQEYFDQWFYSANEFVIDFNNAFERGSYHQAAFLLHQATERYYTTILLVFTDYRPKDHNLETLGFKVEMCDRRFDLFPRDTDEEKRLFELLNKAYLDARYRMKEYQITKDELEYLSKYVFQLKDRTEEICKEKILQIRDGR